jgi:phosphoribosylformylglycinamidine (FGAM) synthase-like enzyme
VQAAASIRGMAAACTALDFPVVSGNVSLYNETEGQGILPTPAIGGLGVLEDAAHAVGLALTPGLDLVLIGETTGWLGQSLWLREIADRQEGPPPKVDLLAERRNGDFVRAQILAGAVRACHDVSDGGLLVAIAEMAMAGHTGVSVTAAPTAPAHAFWFGEDQARYVLATADAPAVLAAARAAGIPAVHLGKSGGDALTLADGDTISLDKLGATHERFFPAWMNGLEA